MDADDAITDALKKGKNDFYLNLCTSFGKSLNIAHIGNKVLNNNKRILCLTPSEELCSQNYKEAFNYVDDPSRLGMVCSGLGKKQYRKDFIIATYQSFLSVRAMCGNFAMLIIDESHLVSNSPKTSIRKIITALRKINRNIRVIGMTGSPFRMSGQGLLENDNKEGKAFFTECIFNSDIPKMISDGWLSSIQSINGSSSIDLSEMSSGLSSDFVSGEIGLKFDAILDECVSDLKEKIESYDIKTAVLFCSTVKNAEDVASAWGNSSIIRVLHAGMSKSDRRNVLAWLVDGNGTRIIVNVGILTTGFNFPALDLIALLRSTKSISLYIQMIGRVIRAHNNNGVDKIGLVYDVGGNIDRHGAIDDLNLPKKRLLSGDMPKKECTAKLEQDFTDKQGLDYFAGDICGYPNRISAEKCDLCGAQFITDDETGNYKMLTKGQVLKTKREATQIKYKIGGVSFDVGINSYGEQYINAIFADDDGDIIHRHRMFIDNMSKKGDLARVFFRNMMKRRDDYYSLSTEGINIKNTLPLLQNHYDAFFKKFDYIMTEFDGKKTIIKNIWFK